MTEFKAEDLGSRIILKQSEIYIWTQLSLLQI